MYCLVYMYRLLSAKRQTIFKSKQPKKKLLCQSLFFFLSLCSNNRCHFHSLRFEYPFFFIFHSQSKSIDIYLSFGKFPRICLPLEWNVLSDKQICLCSLFGFLEDVSFHITMTCTFNLIGNIKDFSIFFFFTVGRSACQTDAFKWDWTRTHWHCLWNSLTNGQK